MARPIRIQFSGAMYHLMSRGDRLEPIFRVDEDRELFIKTLGEACGKAGWEVHAYCLMTNHFHLVIETPQPTLVSGMKWMLGTYTQRFNARHRERGHLFAGRYKSLLVDESDDFYLRVVCNYVHLNPVRAGLVKKEERLESYRWSSYPEYLKTPRKRPSWIRVDRLLGDLGNEDSAPGRRQYAKFLEERRQEECPEEMELVRKVRRGWRLGGDDFLERLETRIRSVGRKAKRGAHLAEEVKETMAAKAERIIAEELKWKKMDEVTLGTLRKMDPFKVKTARRLRGETTMTMAWIAERLHAGTAGTLAVALHQENDK